jgi:hypothetical protein
MVFAVVRSAGAMLGDTPPAAPPATPTETAKPAPTAPAAPPATPTETAKPDPKPSADPVANPDPKPSADPNSKADPPAKAESEPDAAVLAQWKKHVAQWKAIDPREVADNSFCYVCHANYEGEKLVKVHEAEGVGCETCHGMSDKHSQDEDSLVPPDVIFAPAKVASYCGQCHEKRDLLDGDESHEKFFAGQVESEKTCTSCHDMKHTLKVRTRRWDKETRKIEWYDGVRMMQQPDKQQQK